MALGEFQVFNEFAISIGEKKIDLENDSIKMALITDVVTPAATDATPMWAVGSGVDYDGNEVSGTNYVAGGTALTAPALTLLAAVATFDDATDLVWSQSGTGFSDARWGILYSDTSTAKNAIGFLDLGGDVGNVAGDLTIAFNTDGILTLTVSDTIA
jgi:hypothetical protein